MFALVGLVGDRRALSREPGRGGRRCRRDRPDAVELCARGPHGGFHRESTDEIDGMTEDEKLHDEAEEIRKETAEGAPELAEHDRVAELERQLEEANRKALYAAAETQNVRRRLEAEKCSRRRAMPRPASRATCWRSRTISTARWPRSATSFAPTRPRASSSPGSKRPRASSTRCSQRHGISRIKSIGEPLDPHRHQAMIEIPTDEPSRARSSRKCSPAT